MHPTDVATRISSADLEALFTYAVWMHGTREAAAALLLAVARGATDAGRDGWLAALARHPPAARGRGNTRTRLHALDDVLRGDVSIPVRLDHPLVRGEPGRLRVLQSEVKRACLGAALSTLAPVPRSFFLLESLFHLTVPQIAELVGASQIHVQTTWIRALRSLDDYLGSRCEHLDRRNMCHCEGRVGVALERGFIHWPDPREHDTTAAVRTPTLPALYAALPRFRPDPQTVATLLARG